MRIAMIGPFGFHPNKTMQVRARPLATALTRRGHAVQIIMPPWQTPGEAGKRWSEGDVSLHYVKLNGGIIPTTGRLIRAVLQMQPDIVHCFKPKAYSGLAAWWIWQTQRHKMQLIIDSDDWEGWGGWNERGEYSWLQKQFFAWQERWGLTHNHAVTVASRTLQSLAWSLGVPPERVVYVPNGTGIGAEKVEGRGEKAEGGRPTVLLYSRLFEFDTARLMAILRRVQTAVPDLRLLFVGAGLFADEAAHFRQQLAEADLLAAVDDHGWVEPAQLPALLSQADVGLYLMEDTLLNRAKCPVKLADMVALGLPVVGEAVGQVGEYVVNGRSGLLHTSGDNAGLAAALISLLQDKERRTVMSEAARAHFQAHFTWEQLATKLESAYQKIENGKWRMEN